MHTLIVVIGGILIGCTLALWILSHCDLKLVPKSWGRARKFLLGLRIIRHTARQFMRRMTRPWRVGRRIHDITPQLSLRIEDRVREGLLTNSVPGELHSPSTGAVGLGVQNVLSINPGPGVTREQTEDPLILQVPEKRRGEATKMLDGVIGHAGKRADSSWEQQRVYLDLETMEMNAFRDQLGDAMDRAAAITDEFIPRPREERPERDEAVADNKIAINAQEQISQADDREAAARTEAVHLRRKGYTCLFGAACLAILDPLCVFLSLKATLEGTAGYSTWLTILLTTTVASAMLWGAHKWHSGKSAAKFGKVLVWGLSVSLGILRAPALLGGQWWDPTVWALLAATTLPIPVLAWGAAELLERGRNRLDEARGKETQAEEKARETRAEARATLVELMAKSRAVRDDFRLRVRGADQDRQEQEERHRLLQEQGLHKRAHVTAPNDRLDNMRQQIIQDILRELQPVIRDVARFIAACQVEGEEALAEAEDRADIEEALAEAEGRAGIPVGLTVPRNANNGGNFHDQTIKKPNGFDGWSISTDLVLYGSERMPGGRI